MEKLGSIVQIEATQLQARLNFDDERCADIGAFLVLQANFPVNMFGGAVHSVRSRRKGVLANRLTI